VIHLTYVTGAQAGNSADLFDVFAVNTSHCQTESRRNVLCRQKREGEMSVGGIVRRGKCPGGNMSRGEMSYTRAVTVRLLV